MSLKKKGHSKFASFCLGFFLILQLLWFKWAPNFHVLETKYQDQHVDSIWSGAFRIYLGLDKVIKMTT